MGEKNVLFKSSVVVGLVGALPNGVNTLIWGFVGFQSKVAKELKEAKKKWTSSWGDDENSSLTFTFWLKSHAKHKLECIVTNARNKKLDNLRKITERREAFIKMRPWPRRFLIKNHEIWLFPNNGKNRRFIEEQIIELGMRRARLPWDQFPDILRNSFVW